MSGKKPFRKNIRTKILEALRKAGNRGHTIEELVDIIYGKDKEGGPLGAAQTVKTNIWLASLSLEGLDLCIKGRTFYRIEVRKKD